MSATSPSQNLNPARPQPAFATPPAAAQTGLAAQRPVHLFTLSAPNLPELKAAAEQSARYLESVSATPEPGAGDICFSVANQRAGMDGPERLAVLGQTKTELAGKLRQWSIGQSAAGVWHGRCHDALPPRVAFLFTGQGSQYRHMGRELWEHQPVFRAALERCDELLRPRMQTSLVDLVFGQTTPEEQLHQTRYTQPVIFAFGYALARMWASWGVSPALVLGHSIGEVAAACFAGVMNLEEALALVALRGQLIQEATAPGLMGAIVAPAEHVAAALKELGGRVAIAAINGPENVVVSGEKADVQRVLEHFKNRDIPALTLRVSHAVHSPLMDPILETYTAAVSRMSLSWPRIPVISNLSGRIAGGEITRPDYWRRQLRHPVNFRACLECLGQEDCPLALETGATSILTSLGTQCLPKSRLVWLHSLGPRNSMFNMRPQRVPGRSDWETLLETLGQLYTRGARLDWRQIESGFGWRSIALPEALRPALRAS